MAVIGNVGTYATVQPIQGPDFGKMVTDQLDKVEEKKRAEKAAKDKAAKDAQEKKEKFGNLGDLKTTNVNGFNKGLYDAYSQMKGEYEQAINSGDFLKAKTLKDSLATMNNATDMASKKMDFMAKEADDLDPDFVQKNNNILRSINDANTDVTYKGDGQFLLTVYEDPEKTKVLFKDMSPNEIVSKLDAPYKFNMDGAVNEFVKNYKPSSIESKMKDGISTTTVSDIMNDPNVIEGIDSKANELSNDASSLSWFGKTYLNKYETDKNNFSEGDKAKAKEYFKERIFNSYEKEIDLNLQQRTGRSSGGGKDGFTIGTPSVYEAPSITPNGMPTIPLSGAKTVTISNSSGKTLTVGGMPMDRVLYDPKSGKLYVGLLYSASGKEGMGGDGASAGVSESNKFTKWFPQTSDQFDKFKATYNAAFKKNIQTVSDLKNELFL